MTANVRFQQEDRVNVLLVPSEAIVVSEGKTKVQIKGENHNKPEEREIQIGLTDGKRTEIISGLEENEIVIRADLSKMEKQNTSNPFSPMGGRRPPSSGGGGGHR